MSKKNTTDGNPEQKEEKIHVTRSAFQTARAMQQERIDAQEQAEAEMMRKIQEREKKRQEAYDRRIMEEKKELLRLKQGQIDDSELIHEEKTEAPEMTVSKKIGNFFFQNKWWLGLGIFFLLLGAFLIYDLLSRDDPDAILLVTADNQYIGNYSDVQGYIESLSEDINSDGETLVSMYYMPYSDNDQQNYANGTDNKLTVMFQSAEGMITLGDDNTSKIFDIDDTFIDLEKIFPDNPNVKGTKFMLSGTGFAEKIGITEEQLGEDAFLAFRRPQYLIYSTEEEMQETYEKDFPLFEKIIEDLSK